MEAKIRGANVKRPENKRTNKINFINMRGKARKIRVKTCKARYYGKTSRNLAIRCREHIGVTKTGSSVNNNSSAIYNHSSTTGHPVSPEDFSIISSTNNNSDLLIHESLLILRDHPSLNSQTSSIQLTLF